jgi:HAMP domain-containing protein
LAIGEGKLFSPADLHRLPCGTAVPGLHVAAFSDITACRTEEMKNRETMTAFLAAASIFLYAITSALGREQEKIEPLRLNVAAFNYAKELISQGHMVIDGKGAWREDQPSTEAENEFIRLHGFGEYAKWHLGIDDRFSENTKRRYKFPYGDFKNLHRCGLFAAQSRARQYKYSEIENAATQLRAMIGSTQKRNAKR